jgi:hypothetical protein
MLPICTTPGAATGGAIEGVAIGAIGGVAIGAIGIPVALLNDAFICCSIDPSELLIMFILVLKLQTLNGS